MAKKSATRAVQTQQELAELVGRDKAQVHRWTKRDDWPFAKSAPWPRTDVPRILRWVSDVLQKKVDADPDGDPDSISGLRKEKLRQEIRRLRAQAAKDETALEKERGALHDADECEREWVAAGLRVANAVQLLPSQIIPLALSQGLPHEASAILQDQISQLCNAVLRHLSNEPETTEDSTPEVLPGDVPARAVDAERVG